MTVAQARRHAEHGVEFGEHTKNPNRPVICDLITMRRRTAAVAILVH
jgi:hypothetical protein